MSLDSFAVAKATCSAGRSLHLMLKFTVASKFSILEPKNSVRTAHEMHSDLAIQ